MNIGEYSLPLWRIIVKYRNHAKKYKDLPQEVECILLLCQKTSVNGWQPNFYINPSNLFACTVGLNESPERIRPS